MTRGPGRVLGSAGRWGPLLLLAILVLQAAAPRALGADSEGPYREPPAAPATVEIRGIPPGGAPRPTKPFLHPGGQDKLDREKAEAEGLPPGEGIRPAPPPPLRKDPERGVQ